MTRPRLPRALRIAGLVLATLLVFAAAVWTAAAIYYGRWLEHELASLKAEGYPLTLAEAKPPPVPDSENAGLVYLRLFELTPQTMHLREASSGELLKLQVPANVPGTRLDGVLASRATLSTPYARQALATLRQASLLPRCVLLLPGELDLPDAYAYRHFGYFRQAARLLSTQATLDGHDRRLPQALDELATGYRMAGHVAAETDTIAQLVAVAVVGIMDRSAREVITPADLSPAQARPLFDQLTRTDLMAAWQASLRAEVAIKVRYYELARRQSGEVRQYYSQFPARYRWRQEFLLSPLGWPLRNGEEAQSLRALHRGLAENQLTYAQIVARYRAEGKPLPESPAYSIYHRAALKRDKAIVQMRLQQAVLALKAYRHQQGRYPEQLAAVSWPLPNDPFSGRALGYRREGKGFRVWSLGPNLRDDGGADPSLPVRIDDEGDMTWACAR